MTAHRRTFVRGIAAGIAGLGLVGHTTAGSDGRYVVTAGNGTDADRFESAGYEVERTLADGSVHVVWGPRDAAADLERVGGVSGVVPDARLALERPAEEATADEVEEPAAHDDLLWDKQTIDSLAANERATGEGATVAVADTGIDHAHPELVPNLDVEAGRLFREGAVRGGEGEVLVPDDYADPTDLETAEFHVADDQQGHGTHVAGIAAAADGDEVIGTAPEATLVPLRVFWWDTVEDPETGEEEVANVTTTADVLTAIDHAGRRGYDAVNLSLGTAPMHPSEMADAEVRTMRKAYRTVTTRAVQRGTLVVASAGNAGTDLGRGGLFSLPNSTQGALSVSATGPNDELAFYSDYGTSEVDVGAPGGGYETEEKSLDPTADVEWPYPTNLVYSTTSARVEDATHGWKAGTSMAAPQVAGLIALVRELEPDANPNQVESAIKHGAAGDPGRGDPEVGAGRIDALETVERLE